MSSLTFVIFNKSFYLLYLELMPLFEYAPSFPLINPLEKQCPWTPDVIILKTYYWLENPINKDDLFVVWLIKTY